MENIFTFLDNSRPHYQAFINSEPMQFIIGFHKVFFSSVFFYITHIMFNALVLIGIPALVYAIIQLIRFKDVKFDDGFKKVIIVGVILVVITVMIDVLLLYPFCI